MLIHLFGVKGLLWHAKDTDYAKKGKRRSTLHKKSNLLYTERVYHESLQESLMKPQ